MYQDIICIIYLILMIIAFKKRGFDHIMDNLLRISTSI